MKLSDTAVSSGLKAVFFRLYNCDPPGDSSFSQRLKEHFGTDPVALPILTERLRRYAHPNIYLALEEYVSGEQMSVEKVGVVYGEGDEPKLSELVMAKDVDNEHRICEGPIQYLNIDISEKDKLACIQCALYLVRKGEERVAIFLRAEDDILEDIHIEVMAPTQQEAEQLLQQLRVRASVSSIYKGKMLSVSGSRWGSVNLRTHCVPKIDRDGVILPAGLLERIERQTIEFSRHADNLRRAGHHLKRGILLHGRPGTGKTLTAMYLINQMSDRTVLFLTAESLQCIESCCNIAREFQPSIVILEDVDLIAGERTQQRESTPLLFALLNQMDGLSSDSDVLFLLTTNRPEILEPALASRPGRIDQAYEIPLPDEDCRRRLLTLYARDIPLQIPPGDDFFQQTRGVSAAFIRELMRRATILALDDGGDLVISSCHLQKALRELLEGGKLSKKLLGFNSEKLLGN